jgi:hypothetical protein
MFSGGKLTTTQPLIVSQRPVAAIAGGAAAEGPVIEHLKSYSHPRVDRWARAGVIWGTLFRHHHHFLLWNRLERAPINSQMSHH